MGDVVAVVLRVGFEFFELLQCSSTVFLVMHRLVLVPPPKAHFLCALWARPPHTYTRLPPFVPFTIPPPPPHGLLIFLLWLSSQTQPAKQTAVALLRAGNHLFFVIFQSTMWDYRGLAACQTHPCRSSFNAPGPNAAELQAAVECAKNSWIHWTAWFLPSRHTSYQKLQVRSN